MKKSNAQIKFEKQHNVQELGPNWKTVLNFWLFLEGLTDEQYAVLRSRNKMPLEKRVKVDAMTKLSVGKVISQQVKNSLPVGGFFLFATFEIIAAQEILDEAGELTFLPMFDGL